MDTFTSGTYTINASLNERTIYLKIIDLLQYLSYEGNIELKELKLPITLKDAYTLITKCLSNTDDHLVKFSKNTNLLRLDFSAKVGGYMNISFEVMLRECIIGDDARMSMKLIEMEKTHNLEIKKLEVKVKKCEEIIELFGNMPLYLNDTFIPENLINSELITVRFNNYNNASLIKLFYNCKILKNNMCNSNVHISDILHIKNNSCEIIDFNYIQISSISGINQLPNLKEIKGLSTQTMSDYTQGIINQLKYKHNIKKIQISNHSKPDMVNLQKYCTDNSIELIIQ